MNRCVLLIMGVIVFDRSHFQSKSVVSAVAQFQVCSASFLELLSDCLTPPTFLRDWPHLDGGAFKIKTVWSVEVAPRSFHARAGSCALLTCDYKNFHLVDMFKSQDYKLIFVINCFLTASCCCFVSFITIKFHSVCFTASRDKIIKQP